MTKNYPGINGSKEIQVDVLRAICGWTEGKSMIDLGAGEAHHTRLLGFRHRKYVDVVERNIGSEQSNLMLMDILHLVSDLNYVDKFDVSFSLDNIEHFWEEDARKVIAWMERNSHKQVFFTPLGLYMNIVDRTNTDPDTHKSGWVSEDFEAMGYATLVFPQFHPTLSEGGLGALFAFKCENLEQEFERVINELNNKSWLTKIEPQKNN